MRHPKLKKLLNDIWPENDLTWKEMTGDFTRKQLDKIERCIGKNPEIYGPIGNPPEYVVPFLEDIVRDQLVTNFADQDADGILLLQVLINKWD